MAHLTKEELACRRAMFLAHLHAEDHAFEVDGWEENFNAAYREMYATAYEWLYEEQLDEMTTKFFEDNKINLN